MNQWQDTYCLCIPSRAQITCNKKGDKNIKKGDEPKSEDKDNIITGTVGAHVGGTSKPKDSNAPSNGSSTGAHISKVKHPGARPTQSVQEILATHAIDDTIWDHTDACDVSIDTVNSAEALAGSHITGGSTYTFRRSNPHNIIHNDDVIWYDRPYFLENYNKWDKLPNTNGVEVVTNDSTKESIKSDFWIYARQS